MKGLRNLGFEVGGIVTRRYSRGGRCTFEQPLWVVTDDAAGLLLWHPLGGGYLRMTDADGRTLHDVTLDRMRDPVLAPAAWTGADVLILMPPGAAHSVWWFFRDGVFDGWYVNLEAPCTRRPDGVDTVDHVLDIVATPDRAWRWKDEDEFAERTGHPHYYDARAAVAIRAEGERLADLIEAGVPPFDGRLTDFCPDPRWGPLDAPER
ncbi:DUF402 domain-containing protein [Actinoplanes campanulatus]|uniref:DUF402 domain-containing protein n=1 Tax=Actinoplanes campanulatus TaxID=113559 RepID=UPI001EF20843|nr:DUF402 domain-containing protein [Actinoplanes capillaceus]